MVWITTSHHALCDGCATIKLARKQRLLAIEWREAEAKR